MPSSKSSMKQETGRGCVGAVLVMGVVALLVLRGGTCSSPGGPRGAAPAAARSGGSAPGTGESCVIAPAGGERAIAAASLADWERFQQLLRARDELGYSGMLLERRLLLIGAGTKGKVIALHGWDGVREVRLYDGPHVGRVVFVAGHNLGRAE